MATSLLCPHMGKREGGGTERGHVLWVRSHKEAIMLYQGPTLTTSSLSPGMVTFRDEGLDIGF